LGVLVLDIFGEQGFEMSTAQDEHPVEALAAEGADHAFADRVRPRCPDRILQNPDPVGSKDGVEGSDKFDVAVADEELHRAGLFGELHREVAGLLGHPVGDWLSRHAGRLVRAPRTFDDFVGHRVGWDNCAPAARADPG